jgi:RHS repeat-associated protein
LVIGLLCQLRPILFHRFEQHLLFLQFPVCGGKIGAVVNGAQVVFEVCPIDVIKVSDRDPVLALLAGIGLRMLIDIHCIATWAMHEARGQIDCFGAFGFAPVLLDVEDAYTYSASGEKLRKVSGSTTIEYVGGIQYDNLSGTTGVDFIQTEEGRATRRTDGTFRYDYDLTDHLGNVRVSFYKDPNTGIATVLQKDDYYPFGKRYAVYAGSNHYLCNKKELQDATGDYDYGARQYDPAIGRWITLDPMAEVSRRWSPYNYAANNPINKVDVDGLYDQALFDQWEKEDREQKEEDIAKYGLHGG